MPLTRRNLLALSAFSLIAVTLYTLDLPLFKQLSASSATAFRANILPLLRQHQLPYQIWSSPPPGTSNGRQPELGDDTRSKFTRHIVAVGDLHGDMPNARRVLQFSSVTDDKGDWSGNVDFFVQTGDIIDRYVVLLFFSRVDLCLTPIRA